MDKQLKKNVIRYRIVKEKKKKIEEHRAREV